MQLVKGEDWWEKVVDVIGKEGGGGGRLLRI